jgi:hypothetical protein
VLLVGVPMLFGVWHVWLVSKRYFVGSFDDDASYLLTAQALLHGVGWTGHLTSGASVIGAYPPGYSFLLIPLLWIWPHTFTPERVLSVVFYAAIFPLLWAYLGRRNVGTVVRVGALVLLALNPVLATFGSMVMAETSFLVLLLVLLLVVERWDRDARVLGPRGVGIILAGAGLVWLKEAGVGVVLGLGIWYLVQRDWRKAVAVVGGCAVLLLPVVIGRAVSGVPIAGSRYSSELGGYYSGGLLDRLIHVAPHALVHYFKTALPRTVVPFGPPLPQHGAWNTLYNDLVWQAGIFTVLGLGVAIWRHRDAAVLAIPVYAAETLLWPDVNERRVILILPVILGWYALGVVTVIRWVRPFGSRAVAGATVALHRISRPRAQGPMVIRSVIIFALVGGILGYPLIAQLPRDYLFGYHVDSSRPGGSRYMKILAALPQPSTVVETDYESTTALFSGHPTANIAFIDAPARVCNLGTTMKALDGDHAGYLLLATVNKPHVIDNACLMAQASSNPFAVRLLRTNRDQASVFELIGPDTAHPDLTDLVATATLRGSGPVSTAPDFPLARGDFPGTSTVIDPTNGVGVLTWRWARNTLLSQVSIGEIKPFHAGTLTGETLQVLEGGTWTTVAHAPGLVGDGGTPYLLSELPAGTESSGMRLVVNSTMPAVVTDIHALGAVAGSNGASGNT